MQPVKGPHQARLITGRHTVCLAANDGQTGAPDEGTENTPQPASSAAVDNPDAPSQTAVALGVAAVLVLGLLNRISYRLALVPMKEYVFFLAQLQSVGYVLVYGAFLYFRYR